MPLAGWNHCATITTSTVATIIRLANVTSTQFWHQRSLRAMEVQAKAVGSDFAYTVTAAGGNFLDGETQTCDHDLQFHYKFDVSDSRTQHMSSICKRKRCCWFSRAAGVVASGTRTSRCNSNPHNKVRPHPTPIITALHTGMGSSITAFMYFQSKDTPIPAGSSPANRWGRLSSGK